MLSPVLHQSTMRVIKLTTKCQGGMMFLVKQQFGLAFIELDTDMEDATQSVCAE